MCCLVFYFVCEAEGLCVACYIALKKQKVCILFVITFCLIFYFVCEAEGSYVVCFDYLFDICFVLQRSRRLVCLLFLG